jgi:hypothetical protein
VTITGCNPATPSTCQFTVAFKTPYATLPIVTLTPYGNPAGAGTAAPEYWVQANKDTTSGLYTSFTVFYVPQGTVTSTSTVVFNYHVVGS